MRIRRRPPGAQPLAYLLPTDPHPPPPPEGKQRGEGEGELHLHPASATNDSAADLGDARFSSPLERPALPPQGDGAVEERSRGGGLLGAQQQQLQQGPADGRTSSLENGLHLHVPEPATNQAGELLSNNGVGAAVAVTTTATTAVKATKQQKQPETKNTSGGGGGGAKRALRGPGTLLEGSRCSRKNGRGWRCSQPTLVGYALCQYHLGKGRMKSGSAATVGRGPGQLGRTEHANKKTSSAGAAAAVAPATAAAPKVAAKKTSAAAVAPAIAAATAPKVAANVPPPPPPSVQHC